MNRIHPVMQSFVDELLNNQPAQRPAAEDYAARVMALMPAEPTRRQVENAIWLAFMNGWSAGWKESSRG